MTTDTDIENEEAPLVPLLGADEPTDQLHTTGRPNPYEDALQRDAE